MAFLLLSVLREAPHLLTLLTVIKMYELLYCSGVLYFRLEQTDCSIFVSVSFYFRSKH